MTITDAQGSLEELRERFVPSAYLQHHPIFVDAGEGSWITDLSGTRYLDLTGGIAVLNVGHRHPAITAAIGEQSKRLLHIGPVALHEGYVRLAAGIAGRVPGSERGMQVLFANSGAEAVENAVKIARHATGRPAIIAFDRSFHGRTLLTSTLTGKATPYKTQPGSLAPEVYHAPYPYPYRPPAGVDPDRLVEFCLDALDDLVRFKVRPEKVAAMIVEPVQGEGGYIVPPPGFLSALQRWCHEKDVLLIVDEIQTGYGRTGRMFACEHDGVTPDILVLGKSIAAGLPLAAVVASSSIFDRVQPGDIGGTYGGNPLACAAGLAVLDVFDKEGLLQRARNIAETMGRTLQELSREHLRIGEVRGLGTMLAVELVEDPDTREPDPRLAKKVVSEARGNGLLLIKAGIDDNVVRFLPPLTIADNELADVGPRLQPAVRAAMAGTS